MCLKIKKPSECNEDEVNTFLQKVRKGEEVAIQGLMKRILGAKFLAFYYENSVLVGVAALKQPYKNYVDRIFEKASVPKESKNYELEIGWAYTEPDYRGKGICSNLIKKLISVIQPQNIFATTRAENLSMHSILLNSGFQKIGNSYLGRTGEYSIQLYALKGVEIVG